MSKNKEKSRLKLGIGLVVCLAFFLAAVFILYFTGWFHELVPVSDDNSGYLVEQTSPASSASDRENISNIQDYIYCFQGLSVSYQVSLYGEQGTVELALFEIPPEQPSVFELGGLKYVESRIFTGTAEEEWIPEKLKPGRRYALAIYTSEDAVVKGDVQAFYREYRWQYIYENFLCGLPFFDSRYNVSYHPFWDEW